MKMLLVLSLFLVYSEAIEKILPRGISLAQRSLYDSLQDFTCLDGSLRLPFTFVNDDYCDCQDGSDEPGTSACPNGRFHCHNVGFIPLDLPTSRVNDGVCDCCDASDEYLSGNCTNICHMLGAEAKKAAEKEAEIASQGNELRLQMIAAGKDIRQQKQERLSALESDKLEAIRLKEEASRLKQNAESAEFAAVEVYRVRKEERKAAEEKKIEEKLEQEAKDIFNQLDSNQDNLLQREELMVKDVFDQNKDGEITEEEFKVFFNTDNEVTWDSFREEWTKLKPFFILESGQDLPPTDEREQEGDSVSVDYKTTSSESPTYFSDDDKDASKVNAHKEEHQSVEPKDDEEVFLEQELEEEISEIDKHEDEEMDRHNEHQEETNNEEKYDEHTLKLIDEANKARSRLESAERSLQDVERELTRLKESLEKDYGTEDEFIPLDGQCYTYSDREYTYKLCPFDQVVQMGKSGGSETRLGVWAGWIEDSQHKVMLYDKGQTCWNGPQRSTKVTLICGLENAVIGASEPNKCEYELVFQTPAACKITSTIPQQADTHDEF